MEEKTWIRTCVVCGKEFETKGHNAKTCSKECYRKRNNEQCMARRRANGIPPKGESMPVRKKKRTPLEQIAVDATNAGMTYGKYVAMKGL